MISTSANLSCPRLSEARHFLPLLRRHIVAASLIHPLPSGCSIELMPIVEDGLFGYELVPDRTAHTYLIIGRNAQGVPMLRTTLYDADAPNALQLVAIDGQTLSRDERRARHRSQPRDARFADWPAAAEAAWRQLAALFPGRPRQPALVDERRQRSLDEALSVAFSHLERWDPFIHFAGLPKEAERGFALSGSRGKHGELVFQRPDIWMLRWKAPPDAVYESWSVALADLERVRDSAGGDLAS